MLKDSQAKLVRTVLVALALNCTSVHGYCVHSQNQALLKQVEKILEYGGDMSDEQLPAAVQIMSELNARQPEVTVLPVCFNGNNPGECS